MVDRQGGQVLAGAMRCVWCLICRDGFGAEACDWLSTAAVFEFGVQEKGPRDNHSYI